jgi:pimeloyl-ACP methyl ester carboxylesterase
LQIAIAQSLDLPAFRNDVFFNGYAEGWALYAERLAWEMGLYDDDPYGNIGRLDYELLRAVRLVVDTGIHAMRWTREEAQAYMLDVLGSAYEVDRYIVMPAQATGYKIGMLKILELRQKAMDALGDRFDLKAFHNVVLTNGSVPLEILEQLVQKYIDDTLASASAETSYTPVFEIGDCRFEVPQGYQVECGDLIVPESRSQPTGPTIRLHVGTFKSTNPNPAPDPVIHLMGGPGASPLDVAGGVLASGGDAILEERDYILFSQRGTSYAEPFLGCPGRIDFQWELAAQALSLAERNVRELEFWNACRDTLTAQGINLAAYNSAENAADVNDLRLALGYEKVNLYGISYGSRLALIVLRDHPEGVRSAIIDAVWPPQVALDHDVALNAYRSFRAVFNACAADAKCARTYPYLEATFRQVLQELTAHPVTFQFDRGPVVVNGETFLGALYSLLHSVNAIPWIPALITNAAQGQYDEALFEIGGADTYAWGMHYAVRCYEEFAFESQAEALALVADLPPEFRDFFVDHFEYALCNAWQIGTDDPRENEPVVSDVPTLVLSGHYDPILPPAYGRMAAETLSQGYFYEFPNLSHGVMRSNECALTMGLAFLDDPATAPDASCMDDLADLEFEP